MIQSSQYQYNPEPIINRLVPQRQSNVALDYSDVELEIIKLIDPLHDFDRPLADYDWFKPFTKPTITHLLGLTRLFTENEKEDIWNELQILQSTDQYTKYTQLHTYQQKAIELDIHMFEFEFVKGSDKALC